MDDRRRDGGANSTLRIKEQGTHLTLNEHDDDDDDDDVLYIGCVIARSKETSIKHVGLCKVSSSRGM